jgi:hypothetical protein
MTRPFKVWEAAAALGNITAGNGKVICEKL